MSTTAPDINEKKILDLEVGDIIDEQLLVIEKPTVVPKDKLPADLPEPVLNSDGDVVRFEFILLTGEHEGSYGTGFAPDDEVMPVTGNDEDKVTELTTGDATRETFRIAMKAAHLARSRGAKVTVEMPSIEDDGQYLVITADFTKADRTVMGDWVADVDQATVTISVTDEDAPPPADISDQIRGALKTADVMYDAMKAAIGNIAAQGQEQPSSPDGFPALGTFGNDTLN